MKNNLCKQIGENCSICCKLWRKCQSFIKCYNCNKFIHGPNAKSKSQSYSLLNIEEFILYNNSWNNNSWNNKSWICLNCCANEFPFYEVNSNELQLDNITPRNANEDINIILDHNLEDFVKECNLISIEH